MYYLRLQSYQIKNAIGKTFETGDRAIYKHKKYNRFYRNSYPIPEYSNLELYKTESLKEILELRKEMFDYCSEWFDVYDENGKVDILEKGKRMITRADLDKKICDIEGGENTKTYREFIRESEEAFGMANEPIDDYPDDEIDMYIMELDYLWKK